MNTSKIPEYLTPGFKNHIGQYQFKENEIIEFATKYDPQTFHTDPIAAKESLFGSHCASGWHTIAVWMKLQRKFVAAEVQKLQEQNLPFPELGPSPGLRNIKWPRPVFVNDTVNYFTTIKDLRASNSKPGWTLMKQVCEGLNQNDEQVLSFDSTVFIHIP